MPLFCITAIPATPERLFQALTPHGHSQMGCAGLCRCQSGSLRQSRLLCAPPETRAGLAGRAQIPADRFSLCGKDIAVPEMGLDIVRILGVVLDFFPEVPNVHEKRPHVAKARPLPNGLVNFFE